MIGLLPILARWKAGLGIFAGLAFLGLALAVNHYRHAYHAEKALRATDKANYMAAQAEAALIAQRALQATEAKYAAHAREQDHAYEVALADARSAADRYIATHRVHVAAPAQSAPSGTPASAEGGSASVPAGVPSDAVMVSAGDVQACTDAYIYALNARDWALKLNDR